MEFRECDEELFEDTPDEYIRRDTEGSDQETRRRAACDFVRALSANFEEKITPIFSAYVKAMLDQYAADPNANWRRKNAALYLVTSLAAKGQTQKSGITKVNNLVDINAFFDQHVLPELQEEAIDQRPVVKADCLRCVMVFR
jgi:exportin-2 (importin alpha re-exporter)